MNSVHRVLAMLVLLSASACSKRSESSPGAEGEPKMRQASTAQAAAAQEALALAQRLRGANEGPGGEISDTLQAPLEIFFVRLDSLLMYTAEKDPRALLTPMNRVVYPVEGDPRTASLTLERSAAGWRLTSIGDLTADEARTASDQQAPGGGATFLVRIPALQNISFAASYLGGDLTLTPLADAPEYELKQGESLRAREILARLAIAAKQIDPNLPQ